MTSSNGNIFRVTGHLCPTQRPVTRSFDVSFDLRLNKRLNKQSWSWWLETLSCSLWRHCNGNNDDIIASRVRWDGVWAKTSNLPFPVGYRSCKGGMVKFTRAVVWCIRSEGMPSEDILKRFRTSINQYSIIFHKKLCRLFLKLHGLTNNVNEKINRLSEGVKRWMHSMKPSKRGCGISIVHFL